MGLLAFFRMPRLFARASRMTQDDPDVREAAPAPRSLRPGEPGFVERRKIPDRRLQERRKINCKPYIDTRENHGRRRSFGRRSTDPGHQLPF